MRAQTQSTSRVPYEAIFSTVYAGLRINLCLLAAVLPLLGALALSGSPLSAWPFFVTLSVLCGPAVAAAFAVFDNLAEDPQHLHLVRRFWSAYRTGFVRSAATAAVAAGAVIVLGADLRMAVGTRFGAVTPLLAALIGLVAIVTTAVLAAGRRLSRRELFVVAYLSLRKWYLSSANVVVLGVLLAAVVAKPAVGLFLLPAPVLYVVWANARHVLSPLTGRDEPGEPPPCTEC
jgi:uncharacterized membrane protein YesL